MDGIGGNKLRAVEKYDLDGNYIESYTSVRNAGRKNFITPQNIINACKGNAKTAAGYKWKYKEAI